MALRIIDQPNMCGIAGIFDPNGVSKEALKLMSDKIAHRGPDADGFFVHNQFGLAHRRLSIIDLTMAANQPMQSACKRYQMVFNGEVYNHRSIAQEIGSPLKTSSDTEVVLEAFVKWGPNMVKKLNGMFTIAILDTVKNQLFLFRDRVGIKPLFVYRSGNILAFASEIKAITALKSERVKFTINKNAIPYFLHLGYIPQPLSIYNEIEKFPSGCWAMFDGKQLNVERYWNLSEKFSAEVLSDEKDATNKLDRLLSESVEKRLMSDVPFGTFLSGGIDSSLVTALASKSTSNKLKTFSIGFESKKHNEAQFAKQVAKHLGTNHHEFILREKDALDLIEDLIPQYDEPYSDSSAIPTMLVSKMARQEVTMTLSGDGGDELFMGYGAYNWATRLSNPAIRAFRKPISSLLALGDDRKKRAGKVFNFGSKDNVCAHIFSQEQYMFSRAEIDDLLQSSLSEGCFNHLNQNPPQLRSLSAAEA
ncbi:MAG: asparagine synthase (glutamine-hydrolyzing), partial [Flavobacteriales bacterium]